MSNSVIGALRVMLGMDTSAFEDGAKRATRKGKDLEKDFGKIGAGMQKLGLALSGAFAGAIAGMGVLTSKAIDVADELSKAAASTGVAVDELSRLRYAADLSGVSFEGLQTSLGRLSRNMFDASRGTGGAQRAFETMGISVRNADGTLRGVTDVMGDVADRFAGMRDGAEKTALAMQIFGRSGADLIPMLNGGRDGLRELTAEADRFGVVIDAETGRKAEQFNDNLTRLQGVFSAVAARIMADTLPALVAFTDWLVRNQAQISGAVQSVTTFVAGLGQLVGTLGTASNGFNNAFGPAVNAADERLRGLVRTTLSAQGPLGAVIGQIMALGVATKSQNPFGAAVSTMMNMGEQALRNAKALQALAPIAFTSGDAVARGLGGGARSASADLRQLADNADATAARLQSLGDRLFPALARARKLREELALVDGSKMSDDEKASWRFRLGTEGLDKPTVSEGLLGTGPLAEVERVREAVGRIVGEMTGLGDKTEVQTVRIAETFQDMADRALGALRQLADGIKGGGFLSILEGLLGIGTTLGGLGVFGKKVQANLRATPGFANGGAMRLGGFAGIDRNVLSLNGSPIARVTAGETMQIRPANDRAGGALRVTVTMDESTGALGAFVRNEAGQVVAAAAPMIARTGANLATSQLAARQSRMLA